MVLAIKSKNRIKTKYKYQNTFTEQGLYRLTSENKVTVLVNLEHIVICLGGGLRVQEDRAFYPFK